MREGYVLHTWRIDHMAQARVALTAPLAAFALAAGIERASAQASASSKPTIQVVVSVINNTSAKAKGVFQSTDAGDLGTNCSVNANPTGLPNIGCTSNVKTYTNPPKNIKNLLCIQQKMSWGLTPACGALMANQNDCKRNNIFTSLCGAGFAVNVVPYCIYRTQNSTSTPVNWTWTLSWLSGTNNTVISVDCTISGYQGPLQN
jgi:hypothetical protein